VYDADVEQQPIGEFLAEFRPDVVGITANTPRVKQGESDENHLDLSRHSRARVQ
jgi:hypothetical protein